MTLNISRVRGRERYDECGWVRDTSHLGWIAHRTRDAMVYWERAVVYVSSGLTVMSTEQWHDQNDDRDLAEVLAGLSSDLQRIGSKVQAATKDLNDTLDRLAQQDAEIQEIKRGMGLCVVSGSAP